ncbi:IclR family mhp operon transcriptional activator [Variovorax boronicumulans]|uniref:IclR family transcriptional regulator domain-containing protein n=1 Tax=Variovorax boronicumulans TaxID=436515 RepID=UPI002789D3AC|nr:IclR family transcriptional regulator C-terminal domain-containing protein [Variovorax boronicumulans]MDP9912550.1 IclR family mhp operon transcriptional activator [Variovorax boronicumulans]
MKMSHGERTSSVKTINSLGRGLEVLREIGLATAITFSELLARTSLPNASLVRILKTLVATGWIKRDVATGRYTLDVTAAASEQTMAHVRTLSEHAVQARATLQRRVPWPTDLGVRDGVSMLSLDGPYSGNSLSANFRSLGSRPSMLRSSLGRCYLSFCSVEERNEILAALAHSRSEADRAGLNPDALGRMIQETRQRGYATRNASHTSADSPERFGALAVPVRVREQPFACLCVIWLPAVIDEGEIVRTCLPHLQSAARSIEMKLEASGIDPPGP